MIDYLLGEIEQRGTLTTRPLAGHSDSGDRSPSYTSTTSRGVIELHDVLLIRPVRISEGQ
jgi:hypothetical protein